MTEKFYLNYQCLHFFIRDPMIWHPIFQCIIWKPDSVFFQEKQFQMGELITVNT